MEKLQKCVNFILTVPVFFATSCILLSSKILAETFCIIKMKLCSLVSSSLENGRTDLANSFFLNVRDSQNQIVMKKNWKSCPENWKIRKKLKMLFLPTG
jgi:hypothetical protein